MTVPPALNPISRLLKRFDVFIQRTEGIDCTEYVAAIETRFGVAFSIPEVESLKTIHDMVLLVGRKLDAGNRSSDEGVIWETVQDLTSEHMGVARSEIRRTTRYVEDLCC